MQDGKRKDRVGGGKGKKVRKIKNVVIKKLVYPSIRVRVRVTERKLRRKPHP